MDYDKLEKGILKASLDFAEIHGIEFNGLHQSMMLNAMREVHFRYQKEASKGSLSEHDLDVLHDVYLGVMGESLEKERLYEIHALLPDDIKADGVRWGFDDSVVRDSVYVYLRDNLKN